MSTDEKVKELIAQQGGLNEIEVMDGSSLKSDLGLDSLDIVELTMAIEEEFDFNVTDEAFEKIDTVKDLISFVNENKSK